MTRHNCTGDPCKVCTPAIARAEDRRADRDVERPDQWGRTADWNYPRGYGGL